MIRASTTHAPHQITFTNGAHDGVADLPTAKGGAGHGFGPHDLLEAAFATCLVMTAKMFAAEHGIPLRAAGCEVRLDRSVPGRVTVDYELSLDGPLTPDQSARVREAAGRCPVARTLTGAVALRPSEPGGAISEGKG